MCKMSVALLAGFVAVCGAVALRPGPRAEQPPLVVNPRTQEEFVLVRKDRFEVMQKWVASLKRRWDDPADDDLIRKP